jgi:hypothetical protein
MCVDDVSMTSDATREDIVAVEDHIEPDVAQTTPDANAPDANALDASTLDASTLDVNAPDATTLDSSGPDSANDSGPDARDSGSDARDSGPDARDSGSDAGVVMGGCVSGATGTHVARFRWTGSGSGSRASVSYETNTLPDSARWRAGAYSRGAIGYTPVYSDTFLGPGGLEMGTTVFMDVELSTAGLGSISNVTLAVYGRSFNTTSPGSFSWMTFDGSGATSSGFVANSAPYQWYRANATAAFRPGNAGVLLRISPGGPSGTLIVNRVELCFDAR